MFFKKDLVLAQEYLAFLILNLFDLFLTGYIFRHNGMEANGIAAWVLTHYGLAGFAVYKFLLVVVVIVACEGYSFKSLRISRGIVTVGCVLYLAVILYECYLIRTHITHPVKANTETTSFALPSQGVKHSTFRGGKLCAYSLRSKDLSSCMG